MASLQMLPTESNALLYVVEHLNIDADDRQTLVKVLSSKQSKRYQLTSPYSALAQAMRRNPELATSVVQANPKRRVSRSMTEQAIDVVRSRFLEATQASTPFVQMVTEQLATLPADGSSQRFSIHIERHGPVEVVVHGRNSTLPSECGSLDGATEGASLFHGTSLYSASSIITEGIDYGRFEFSADFGQAFYTTPDWRVAYTCALVNELPFQVVAILEFDADVLKLKGYDILSIKGSRWHDIVRAHAEETLYFVKHDIRNALIVTGLISNRGENGQVTATDDVQFAFRPGNNNLGTLRSRLSRVHILPTNR